MKLQSYISIFAFLSFALLTSASVMAGSLNADEASAIELLKSLVTISSGTSEPQGVSTVQKKVAEKLKNLGFQIHFFASSLVRPNGAAKAAAADMMVAERGEAPFVMFVGHADTVFENAQSFEVIEDAKTNSKKIKGPGVGDDKGGLVVGLNALEAFLKAHPNTQHGFRFVVTSSEEIGSDGFREKLDEFSKDSKIILGLEPALADGSIVKARKGVRWYLLNVKGVEAHAGSNPQDGVNACDQLAIDLQKITALSEFEKGNTLSVGHIEGGKNKFNIVCGEAQAKIDFRFVDISSRDRLDGQLRKILSGSKIKARNGQAQASAEIQIVTDVPPFAIRQGQQKKVDSLREIIRAVEGRSVNAVLTGAAADLNYMTNQNVPMLDGLGPVGGGFHTKDEYIEAATLVTRAQALVRLLEGL
jgi:glutamate carboxypeptidase